MNTLHTWSSVVPLLALAIPVILALAAALAPRRAGVAAGAALVLALLMPVGAALAPVASATAGSHVGVRVDAVTCVMLLLVSGLGAIIVRYSVTYLAGDPALDRHLRWLMLTLGAVTTLVITSNLLVLALGWTATSLALHQLLTLYPERPAALVAAHKKFLVSRLADACLMGCIVLVYREVGSLDLDSIADWVAARGELTVSMQVAALLVVNAVALRSAQLPFHGWLTQVMEAPTPVSALLHAGVVNIGGFVLIRLSPWMAYAEAAQLLLVVVGLASAILGALVMTTRVSVKVALAWSTCAQMGFMLVQCGLGLWHLALLHLVAHSLYKAHAFLSAGTAVDEWRLKRMAQPAHRSSLGRLALAVVAAVGTAALSVAAIVRLAELPPGDVLPTAVLGLLVSLSMVPLLGRVNSGAAETGALLVRIGGVAMLYVGWHALAAQLMPARTEASSDVGWWLLGVGLAALFAMKSALHLRPDGRLARAMYPWLFAGFYLDERFTRLTFRVWPLRRPEPARRPPTLDLSEPMKERA